MSAPLLQSRDLAVRVAGKSLCFGLSFSIGQGESWALLGLNGSGKTTLLLTLSGLRAPSAGEISFLGEPLGDWSMRRLARHRALLPQDTHDPFPLTVLEAVLAGRFPHQDSLAWDSPEDGAIARAALEEVGLADLAQRDCATLSGGERRRVALAAVLAQQPDLYFLDEPANHLDPHHQIALIGLLESRRRAGKSVMLSLHDPNLAARFCTHALLLMGEGEALHGPVPEVLTPGQLSRLYRHEVRSFGTPAGIRFEAA